MARHGRFAAAETRRRIYEILEQGALGDRPSRLVDRLIVFLIIVNLITVTLGSVPAYAARYGALFAAVEIVSLIAFTIEYALRLWVAPEHAPDHHLTPRRARMRFALSAAGLIDLLAVLPFWLAFVVPADLRVILVFRVVRFLMLTRYSPAMRSLLDVIYAERRALFGCLVILIGATLIAAAVMHVIERGAQPEKFGTIPEAMWWAIVTLGTIGYGDVVPVTPLGKIVGAFVIFGGLMMVALPVGIIATAFAEEIHRRDFVVTWSMVARVPLFAGLDAGEIGEILRLLRAQSIEPGGVVTRRGDTAHSMYFIAAGEVEIELPQERVRLGIGHFFGEVAVLRRARRSATVTATMRTNLLVLDAHDLHALMEREPRVAERIRAVMRDRLGHELVGSKGDIVTEEIEEEGRGGDKA